MGLSGHHPQSIEQALRQAPRTPAFPPASDRRAWAAVAERIGAEGVAAMVARAEAAAEPVPALPATPYLDFRRRGERARYEQPARRRRSMLASLALAECLEDSGRFHDALLDGPGRCARRAAGPGRRTRATSPTSPARSST